MGIDELVNFIESKDNKKSGRKGKKKVNRNTNKNERDRENQTKQVSSGIKDEEVNEDDNDSELEQFKSKLIGDSIQAKTVKKIKPKMLCKWE